MPSDSKIYDLKGHVFMRVLCFMCREPIEAKRRIIGKAFCEQCENMCFSAKSMGKVRVPPNEDECLGPYTIGQRRKRTVYWQC